MSSRDVRCDVYRGEGLRGAQKRAIKEREEEKGEEG